MIKLSGKITSKYRAKTQKLKWPNKLIKK